MTAFLLFDTADRWLGARAGEHPISGVLAFPFSLLAVAAALALTVWVARSWGAMGGEDASVSGDVDKGGA
ncbi:MAG: hypothetical protein ACE5JS_14505 [Nitrospinota bacterium]